MDTTQDLRIAVLIDADNVPYKNIKSIIEEVTRYGTPVIKRIYGDWTKPNLAGWKPHLLENAITPIQQYGYTTGKNATDSAMIIDAMDILYSPQVIEGFCIVSSDSDFTRLAIRLREAGKKVFGIGEKKTPMPFIAACDRFIYIEVIESHDQQVEKGKPKITEKTKKQLRRILRNAIDDVADEEGWAFLGEVGNLLVKKYPDFDSRNYGFSKMTPMIRFLKTFEIDERPIPKSNIKHVFIRYKNGN
ncbi:MAG: NYN domain-containing protein [Erysipelothrix sp.]|nr:NYN domain-containing protein [Erysipelothrix sp.]